MKHGGSVSRELGGKIKGKEREDVQEINTLHICKNTGIQTYVGLKWIAENTLLVEWHDQITSISVFMLDNLMMMSLNVGGRRDAMSALQIMDFGSSNAKNFVF